MFVSVKHKINIFLGGGIFLLLMTLISYQYFSVQSTENEATHQIVLRDDGFHPTTTKIYKGDTVEFVTQRGKYFWPASNQHPAHTVYSEFDSKRPVAPTESWKFTFTKTGTWGFHDHLHSFFTGVVIVE